MARFTIITPALNAGLTIADAVDSVKRQGRGDVQHVVVDGGSTDRTADIARQFKGVEVISEPDDGLSDALNKGIARARGDIIGWLNADDQYLPGALDAIDAASEKHPEAEWFTGRCPIVNAEGRRIRKFVTGYKNLLLSRYSLSLFLTQNFISCPATFVTRLAYEEVGPYRTDYHYSMDYDMFLRLAKRSDPVVLERDIAVFRMTPGTKSMDGFELQFREHHQQAREHGCGHPIPVAANQAVSGTITLTYRALRRIRR